MKRLAFLFVTLLLLAGCGSSPTTPKLQNPRAPQNAFDARYGDAVKSMDKANCDQFEPAIKEGCISTIESLIVVQATQGMGNARCDLISDKEKHDTCVKTVEGLKQVKK